MNRFSQFARNNSDALLQSGIGLLSGQTGPEQLAKGAQGFSDARKDAKKEQKINQTIEYLRKMNPELAQAAQAGLIEPGAAFKMDYEQRQGTKAEPTSTMREFEYAQGQGFGGSFMDYQNAKGKAGQSNTTVQVNTGEGNKFYDEMDKGQAQMFQSIMDEGIVADSKLMQIDELDRLIKASPHGITGVAQLKLGEWGIESEGLNELQAVDALINQIIPQQRPPGSGEMSDADLALFRRSVPQIINQPGGNEKIIKTMRDITLYSKEQARVAGMVADRTITPAEGRKMLQSLSNPVGWIPGSSGGDYFSGMSDAQLEAIANGQ